MFRRHRTPQNGRPSLNRQLQRRRGLDAPGVGDPLGQIAQAHRGVDHRVFEVHAQGGGKGGYESRSLHAHLVAHLLGHPETRSRPRPHHGLGIHAVGAHVRLASQGRLLEVVTAMRQDKALAKVVELAKVVDVKPEDQTAEKK